MNVRTVLLDVQVATAVAQSMPQLLGKSDRSPQSWTTNADMSSGTKLEQAGGKFKARTLVMQHECGLTIHCGKAPGVSLGNLQIL